MVNSKCGVVRRERWCSHLDSEYKTKSWYESQLPDIYVQIVCQPGRQTLTKVIRRFSKRRLEWRKWCLVVTLIGLNLLLHMRILLQSSDRWGRSVHSLTAKLRFSSALLQTEAVWAQTAETNRKRTHLMEAEEILDGIGAEEDVSFSRHHQDESVQSLQGQTPSSVNNHRANWWL